MQFQQLVTTVANGTVEAQGLTPNLEQQLMLRLMNVAPSSSDLEDHFFPAYSYFGIQNKVIFGRTYSRGIGTAQTNFIIGTDQRLTKFNSNPALFAFIANAEGMLHDKNQDCPNLPELDFQDGASRFEPVFEDKSIAALATETLDEMQENSRVAVLGIKNPFRFLIPLIGLLPVEKRLGLSYCVNSSYLPKDDEINVFVFPSVSARLLNHLEEAKIRVISVTDTAKA